MIDVVLLGVCFLPNRGLGNLTQPNTDPHSLIMGNTKP